MELKSLLYKLDEPTWMRPEHTISWFQLEPVMRDTGAMSRETDRITTAAAVILHITHANFSNRTIPSRNRTYAYTS